MEQTMMWSMLRKLRFLTNSDDHRFSNVSSAYTRMTRREIHHISLMWKCQFHLGRVNTFISWGSEKIYYKSCQTHCENSSLFIDNIRNNLPYISPSVPCQFQLTGRWNLHFHLNRVSKGGAECNESHTWMKLTAGSDHCLRKGKMFTKPRSKVTLDRTLGRDDGRGSRLGGGGVEWEHGTRVRSLERRGNNTSVWFWESGVILAHT